MAIKNVGVGSQYLIAYLDKDGNALDGNKTYKINLPKNIPAKTSGPSLYDNQTRSMLQTDQQFPGIDSLGKGQSQCRWFNRCLFWSQGPGWNGKQLDSDGTRQRLEYDPAPYGPLQPYYDKTWKPSDPELVK